MPEPREGRCQTRQQLGTGLSGVEEGLHEVDVQKETDCPCCGQGRLQQWLCCSQPGPGERGQAALGSIWGGTSSSFSFQVCVTEGDMQGRLPFPGHRVLLGPDRMGWELEHGGWWGRAWGAFRLPLLGLSSAFNTVPFVSWLDGFLPL